MLTQPIATNPWTGKASASISTAWKDKFLADFSREHLGVFETLVPFKEAVVHHPLLERMAAGTLPVETFRQTIINFFPLIENFPKFMALNLAKTRCDRPAHDEAKAWLCMNIKIEKNHANWYKDWAKGFGVSEQELIHAKRPPEVEAIVEYLWSVASRSSVSACFASANVGIEWATGEWSWNVKKGVASYLERGLVDGDPKKTMVWIKVHADYDDKHPYEAMAHTVRCAESEAELMEAIDAAKRSLSYYRLAFDSCSKLIH